MHRKPNPQPIGFSNPAHAIGTLSRLVAALAAALLSAMPTPAMADPPPAAVAAFNKYTAQFESALALRHNSPDEFLAPFDRARVRAGEVIVEQITPGADSSFPGAMLHHWRGTAFVPGARAVDLEKLLRDYSRYPTVYAPQVIAAKVLAHSGNHYQTMLRLSQKHVITIVLDAKYDIHFYPASMIDAPGTPQHGYDISHSTSISEIADPGTAKEHALDSGHEHGFLWRLNTYWSWEERDGGLYMQIETISLTRAVPAGLGWAVGPFVNSIPRESLEFTLHSTATALHSALPAERTQP